MPDTRAIDKATAAVKAIEDALDPIKEQISELGTLTDAVRNPHTRPDNSIPEQAWRVMQDVQEATTKLRRAFARFHALGH